MTGKTVPQKKKLSGFSRLWGRRSLAVVFLAMFLFGYNLTMSRVQQCSAQIATPVSLTTSAQSGSCPAGVVTLTPACTSCCTSWGYSGSTYVCTATSTNPVDCTGFNPPGNGLTTCGAMDPILYCFVCGTATTTTCTPTACEPIGIAATVAAAIFANFDTQLRTAAGVLENWLYTAVSDLLQSEYDQMDWLERSMIDWWNTMWSYNLLPGLQGMARQLNIDLALQALQLHLNADASAVIDADRALNKHAIEDHGLNPGEQVCVATTLGGGYTGVTALSRAMRQAWENKSLAAGLNTTVDGAGQPYIGTASAIGSYQQVYRDYHNIFCDPNGNSGHNNCASYINILPAMVALPTNADVEPIRYIYNNLTINVNDPTGAPNGATIGANLETAVEDIINNMVGLPAADPIITSALGSTAGQQNYLARRSYLARYAAIRSVPDMVAGWRMPGSTRGAGVAGAAGSEAGNGAVACAQTGGIGPFVCDLRQNAGIPLVNISKNPSYKEIMHALSIDRFNSGIYAAQMMTDPNKIEMEKLNLSVFYLMQLRDYYELLERTALTLAVQVSVMSGQYNLPAAHAVMPLK